MCTSSIPTVSVVSYDLLRVMPLGLLSQEGVRGLGVFLLHDDGGGGARGGGEGLGAQGVV